MLCSQSLEHFNHFVRLHFSFDLVFSGTDIHSAVFDLGLSNHQLEVVLSNLGVTELLVQGSLPKVNIGIETLIVEFLSDFGGIIIEVVVNLTNPRVFGIGSSDETLLFDRFSSVVVD